MAFVRLQTAQSTAAWRHLPAGHTVALALLIGFTASLRVAPARAQQTVTIERDGQPFLADVGGSRLGRFAPDVALNALAHRNGHTQVTLEGWVFRPSLQATQRDTFDLVIGKAPEENVRAAPNGRLLAVLVAGTLVKELERRGQWTRVRRSGWVADGGLHAAGAAVTPPARPAAPPRGAGAAADTGAGSPDAHRAVVRRRMQLYRAPDSAAVGTLEAGTPVRVTERAGDWVRVEAQAWVRQSEIRLADSSILTGVSAAELRGASDEFRGRLLRWTIQFLALQTADELRPDFVPGQKYILARGPAPEYAFVYVLVPDDKLAEVQRIAPLASVTVVARVVNGRSAYLANPILELVELQ